MDSCVYYGNNHYAIHSNPYLIVSSKSLLYLLGLKSKSVNRIICRLHF